MSHPHQVLQKRTLQWQRREGAAKVKDVTHEIKNKVKAEN